MDINARTKGTTSNCMSIPTEKVPKQLNLFETIEKQQFSHEELDTEYFTLFSWAVPRAFSDPLDLCRFEEGDTLYDTIKAYLSPWSEALQHIEQGVQVTFPPKAIQKTNDKDTASVFQKNWTYPLKLDLLTFENNKLKNTKHINTTQGAFYTFLWFGNEEVLHSNESPPIPLGRKALKASLNIASIELQKEVKTNYQFTEAFIMPYDKSSSLLQKKYSTIVKALESQGINFTLVRDRPKPIKNTPFCPTLQIVCFIVNTELKSVLYKGIKSLYKPSKDKKNKTEQFNTNSHGIYLDSQ